MTQKVFPAAVRARHGGNSRSAGTFFRTNITAITDRKRFRLRHTTLSYLFFEKSQQSESTKSSQNFFCNFHRKFTLCSFPVTIPKTQKSLFSSKYGTFCLSWFPLTCYFVSLNEIIQIPSYALPFGIADVCSQIFRGYAGMQRVFRMVQLLLPSGVFSLCASVQQGGKYDNNLKYMHRIIRFVFTVRQLMQRYYGFPWSVCGLVVGMTVLYLC